MNITFYKTNNDKRDVSKTLTNAYQMTGTMRDACSIINPTFTIESIPSITTYNYCYIPDFGRYYFIKEITCVSDVLYEIKLDIDVLMSYKTQIKSLTAVIERQEGKYNMYLADGEYKKFEYDTIGTFTFSGGDVAELTPQTVARPYILTVAGGYN